MPYATVIHVCFIFVLTWQPMAPGGLLFAACRLRRGWCQYSGGL